MAVEFPGHCVVGRGKRRGIGEKEINQGLSCVVRRTRSKVKESK